MNEETEKKDVEIDEALNQESQEIQDETAENVEEIEAEIVDKEESNQEEASAEELAKLKEEIMRMRAEADNVRKRNVRDLDNLRKFSIDKFAKALLPIADSMDKELENNAKEGVEMSVKQMIEGTVMTQNMLLKVLTDNGIEIINPEGEKFNPEFHEAMTQIPHPDLAPNTIVDVFQKGYILNGRLIRPAMVVVSK